MAQKREEKKWRDYVKVALKIVAVLIPAATSLFVALYNAKANKQAQAQKHTDNMEEKKKEWSEKNNFAQQEHTRKMEEMELQHQFRMDILKFKQEQVREYSSKEGNTVIYEPNIPVNDLIYGSNSDTDSRDSAAGLFLSPGGIRLIVGGTNYGKSTLATQIGESIARGIPCAAFPELGNLAFKPQKVIMYDAEQDREDWARRYGRFGYRMSENFERAERTNFDSVEEFVADIRHQVASLKSDGTIIVDNIASHKFNQTNETILELFNELKEIMKSVSQRGICLTILFVAHTTKEYSPYAPIEIEHIQGSSNISRFAKSIIAIGPTRNGENQRYLKVLKNREHAKPDKEFLVNIVEEPFLHFEYEGEAVESDILPMRKKANKGASTENKSKKSNLRPYETIKGKEKDEIREYVKQLIAQDVHYEDIIQRVQIEKGVTFSKTTISNIKHGRA